MNTKRACVLAGLFFSAVDCLAGIRVVGEGAQRYGRGYTFCGVGGATFEGFDAVSIAPGLRVACDTPNGGYGPTQVLPSTFSASQDAYGTRFGSLSPNERLLINTRTNQTFPYGSLDDYGDLSLQFNPPIKAFGGWLTTANSAGLIDVYVNGQFQTSTQGLGLDLTWGYSMIKVFAEGSDSISSIRFHPSAEPGGNRLGLGEIGFSTSAQPTIIAKGFSPSRWGASDHELGMGGTTVENFEDSTLAPHLIILWNAWFADGGASGTLPNVFRPGPSSQFQPGVWSGTACLTGGVNNLIYPDFGDWGDIVLRLAVPARRVGFSLQGLDKDARLYVNDRDIGSIASLGGFQLGTGRQGYLRLQAQHGDLISYVRIATGFLPGGFGNAVTIDQLTFGNGCLADFNDDTVVDDTDFQSFARAYSLISCGEPAGAPGCPADINGDWFVDDSDFAYFAGAYDALLCP